MPDSSQTRALNKLEERVNLVDTKIAVLEASMPDIKEQLREINHKLTRFTDASDARYASQSQIRQLEKDMNSRFDDLSKELRRRTSTRTSSMVITVVITSLITGLIGLAFWEIQQR